MRQIWISMAGPPEALTIREAPDPEVQKGEMRVRVEASGVNFADIMGRMGLDPDFPPIPVVPGYEIAGCVDAVGGGVDASWVGRDVFALTRLGGYADVVCVPQAQVFARPQSMSAEEGASIPVSYLTAWRLIVVVGGLKKADAVLIRSAGGGLGIAAAQIAKHIGAQVIGTASGAEYRELRALGVVDQLINDRTEDFEERTWQFTGGRGVELILDADDEESLKTGYRVFAPPGRLGAFGAPPAAKSKTGGMLGLLSRLATSPRLQFDPLSLITANKEVFRADLGHMWGEIDRMRGWLDQLMSLWERGAIRPKIARTFSFEEAALAHHFIRDRKTIGKVLLIP
jgi:synaptic vesicle membrane protein VAT-1